MININKFKTVLALSLLISGSVYAQPGVPPPAGISTDPVVQGGTARIVNDSWKPSLRKDGVVDKVEHNNYVTPWAPIREADVLFKKRVWREIDTRQKQNFAFRYPGDDESGGGMYIEILLDAIKKGEVTAFKDERFTDPMSAEDVMTKLAGKADSIAVENPETGEITIQVILKQFNPDDITKFQLKEDWIFDKNIGRMVVRIIGFAPFYDKKNTDGSFRASLPLFYVYYPDIRANNAKYEVYNPENDVYRYSWDDFFEKRMFSSYVLKTTMNNPFQDDIMNLKTGIDRLNQSEEIKEKLFNKEHDLWVY
jgi:gliding motility associated protien GldN